MNPRLMTPNNRTDPLEAWRADVFVRVARLIAQVGTLTYFILIGVLFDDLNPTYFIAYTAAYLLVLAAAFATRIPVMYRAYSMVFLIFMLGILASAEKAAMGDGRVWFAMASILAAIFLGRRAGFATTIVSGVTWGLIGVLFSLGLLNEPASISQFSLEIWGGTTVTLLMGSLTAVFSIGALLVSLNKSITESMALAKTAEAQSDELEKQRNALQRRSNALETSAQISRKVAALTSSENILLQAPIMIRSDFNLLSAAFFRLGEDNRLYLASCDGWNEQAHPKHDYVVALEDDITGAAIIQGKAMSNKDYDKGLIATLSETRSYASIPMRGRSKTIGVLLIQSDDFDGLGSERLATLQLLADQIAILMENADLLAEKESALEAERRAYGDITEAAWLDFIQDQQYAGYMRDKNGLRITDAKAYHPGETPDECHRVPIQLRGKTIGFIDAHKAKKRSWTMAERELLNTLAGRLENALDSARLYEEIQERATREHLVSSASSRMRENLEVQAVLKVAAEELHKALGDVAETEIWIAPEDNKPATE